MIEKVIGWIGTGLMGYPMVKHLLKAGYTVNVSNRTRARAEDLIQMGCTWFDSAGTLAAASDVVVTIIGSPEDVEQCYFGDNGIFSGVRPGTMMIDMTTTKPSLAVRIAAAAEQAGAYFMDAPVSGGEVGAVNGTLSIMIGGKEELLGEVLPIFQTFGKNMVYQGAAGSGQHTKMCNQIVIASTLVGVCESLLYGMRAGLDLNTMLGSISKGAAGCWSLDVLAPKIIRDDFSPGFSVDNFVKDMRIALEEADAMKLCLPGLALAKQLYTAIQAMNKGSLGNQSLYLALASLSGMDMRNS